MMWRGSTSAAATSASIGVKSRKLVSETMVTSARAPSPRATLTPANPPPMTRIEDPIASIVTPPVAPQTAPPK